MMTSRRTFLGMTAAACLGAGRFGLAAAADDDKAARPLSILFLGGTGFLGPQTVEEAVRRGHKVTLFNRGKTRPGLFPDLEKLQGDRETGDLKALEGREWDAVIDTSANVPRWVRQVADVLGPKIGHYIYISSVSVYADMSQPGADESAPLSKIDDIETETVDGRTFGALKALSEAAAAKAMPGKTAIVRPGLIVGPDDPTDRFSYWPARVARGGEVLAPGTPDDPIQLIDVRDLAAFLVRLVEAKAVNTYNALGPDRTLTIGRMLDACKAAAQSDVTFTWADAAFLDEQKVRPWSDLPVWLPPSGDTAGFARLSNARAVAAGLTFRPIAETAAATLEWLRAQPEDRRTKLRAGLTPEREAEVLAAWKASRRD